MESSKEFKKGDRVVWFNAPSECKNAHGTVLCVHEDGFVTFMADDYMKNPEFWHNNCTSLPSCLVLEEEYEANKEFYDNGCQTKLQTARIVPERLVSVFSVVYAIQRFGSSSFDFENIEVEIDETEKWIDYEKISSIVFPLIKEKEIARAREEMSKNVPYMRQQIERMFISVEAYEKFCCDYMILNTTVKVMSWQLVGKRIISANQ